MKSRSRPVRRATARDVAKIADCSVATVSLIVNGKSMGRVNPATEERVWRVVRQLDYRVNSTASALARGTPNTVAMVCPDPTNPFFASVLDGVMSGLGEQLTLNLITPNGGEDYGSTTVQRAMAGEIAGLILASPGQFLFEGVKPTCPVIVLDAEGQYKDYVTFDLDIAAASRDLASHLGELGHRRVAYVGLERDKETLLHRREKLRSELLSRGADLVVPDIMVRRLSVEAAHDAILASWDTLTSAEVTAVVCGDDLLAYGFGTAAKEKDISIPADVSLASFNNLPYSAMMSPSLTSVDLSARELGVHAISALRSQLEQHEEPTSDMLPSRLVIRESTGVARS
jgi:DNA-binding LacI/PurR family transcriptional regulator